MPDAGRTAAMDSSAKLWLRSGIATPGEREDCRDVQGWVVVIIAVAYVIAAVRDRQPRRPPQARVAAPSRPRPYIYALSLAIYCTSWTFFGSVGLAAERGLEFLAIYIGPVLVFLFGFPLLQPHHPARQGREDHLDRRLPRRALRQELRRRGDRHADRRRSARSPTSRCS